MTLDRIFFQESLLLVLNINLPVALALLYLILLCRVLFLLTALSAQILYLFASSHSRFHQGTGGLVKCPDVRRMEAIAAAIRVSVIVEVSVSTDSSGLS